MPVSFEFVSWFDFSSFLSAATLEGGLYEPLLGRWSKLVAAVTSACGLKPSTKGRALQFPVTMLGSPSDCEGTPN